MDEGDELELSLGLSIGSGKKRKAEIDFLSGSFPAVGSAKEEIRPPSPTPIPEMPTPCRSLPPLGNPNPNPNLNLNENPNPNHEENGGKRSVRMKRTPSYSGSPRSCSSGSIRERRSSSSSSNSETRSHSDPYATDHKPNKQSNQEVASKPTPEAAAAAAEKVDPMPCVMTMGRNGNAVNGILYRYNEREVSIVCICHGTPFSPEGFIRHAGGMESSNPLRQIMVVPC